MIRMLDGTIDCIMILSTEQILDIYVRWPVQPNSTPGVGSPEQLLWEEQHARQPDSTYVRTIGREDW